MSEFTPITLADMRDRLKPEKGWKEATTSAGEYVFDWTLPGWPGIVVRVYSSIRLDNAMSRGKGKDAIRVCGVDTDLDKGLRKAKKVLRVAGWRENLKTRVMEVIVSLRQDFMPNTCKK